MVKAFFLFVCCTLTIASFSQKELPLYTGKIPNARGPAVDRYNRDKSVYHRVAIPTLQTYLLDKPTGPAAAVIICAGGGYAELNIKREGHDIATAFSKAGVAAFVLKYRLPDDKTNVNKTIAPLQDAQQALKIVSDSATRWNIDPARIGIMGFSAGGHLASAAGVHHKDVLIPDAGTGNLRPGFMILVYPVISFSDSFGHVGSRKNLIGNKPAPDSIHYFSNELHVNAQTPPAFIITSGDDAIVPVANSVKFYEALSKYKVPAELHIYQKGGHGFGTTPTFDEWFGRCLLWMKTAQLIK